MPPSRGQLPKKFQDSLERIARQRGQAGDYVTPNYDRILGAYQPESGSGGGGLLGVGKNLGKGILNALSVPQAAIGTSLFKASQLIPGSKAKDKDIPWAAALGDFYRNEEGRTGWQELTEEGMGLDSRQGFALGLFADPLWGVGLVTKPARAAKAAADAKKVSEGSDTGTDVVRQIGPGSDPAPRYPLRQGEVILPRSMRAIQNVTQKVLRPIREGRIKGPDETVLFDRFASRRASNPMDNEYILPDELIGRGPSSFFMHRSRPKQPPKATKPEVVRTRRGTFVGDDYFITLGKKPHRGKRQYTVYQLKSPGKLAGAKKFKETFEGRDAAIEWARARQLKADTARSPYAVAQSVVTALPTASNISDGTFGRLLNNVMSRTNETKQFAKRRVEGNNEVFLRIGFGDKLSKDLKLGTTKAKAFNNARVLGGLGRSPLERATHQVKVSNDELTQIAIKFLDGVKDNWKKGLGLSDEAAEAAAQRVGMVAIAANQSPEAAAALRATMRQEGLWDNGYDDLLAQLREHWDQFADELGMSTNKAPGPYAPQAMADDTVEAMTERFRGMVERGEVAGNPLVTGSRVNPTEARKFDSSFAAMTKDEAIEQLARTGVSRESAEAWADTWQKFAPEGSRFADETTGFSPEFDMFKLANWREQGQMKVILDRQINELAAEAGVFSESALKALKSNRPHGPLAETKLGEQLMGWVSVFKTILTTINPSHYVRNVVGDYINHLINGNLRHMQSGAYTSRNPYWRITRGDEEALAAKYRIGDQEYSGAELLVESAFMGLGRGYVGSDIAQMMDLMGKGLHKKGLFKWATEKNMRRENAVRLETYVKHRQGGDDMMTAAAKTLRVHFDYSDLTDFEKYIMRNMLLFYTWLRRNSVLQMSGVFSRPGLYSAAATMEQYRPKLEGEPGYLGDLAMLGAPGLGWWNVGNPMEALNRLEPSGENMRQTFLGAVNPLVRVPTELAINQNVRTGYDLKRGPGDVQPGLAPTVLDALGFDMPRASFTGYSPPGPAMDPNIKHIIENLLLVGPYASTTSASLRPEEEYRPDAGVAGLVERLVGVRRHRPDPEQAARRVAATIRDIRREHDIRKKYAVQE